MNIVGDHEETKQTLLARADRDDYIQINWDNIREDKKREFLNFGKKPFNTF